MKLTTILLLAVVLQVSAHTSAQTVNYTGTNIPLEQVFSVLKEQTRYKIFYREEDLEGTRPVTVSLKETPLLTALKEILEDQPLEFTIERTTIFISRKPKAASSPQVSSSDRLAVPQPITGRVVDSLGNGIEGASIRLIPGNKGTSSGNDGSFLIANVSSGNYTLEITRVGYTPISRRVTVTNDRPLALGSLVLRVNPEDMENIEIVSTGYQDIPKERATGSFVLLGQGIINRSPATNILDRISNVTSSLLFEPRTNSGTNLTIRGYSTIKANKQPLYVVDGFPYEEKAAQSIIAHLNPNDVESITILRDAAAASIWGARSGNGVIVITTKKGNYNTKLDVQLTSNLTYTGKPEIGKYNIISSADAIAFEKKRFEAGSFNNNDVLFPAIKSFPIVSPAIEILLAGKRNELTQGQVDEQLAKLAQHDIRNDLTKYFIQGGLSQQYNLSLRGGSNKFAYYTSFGYDNVRPNAVQTKDDRYTIRFDNKYTPFKFIEVSSFINYTQAQSKNPGISYSDFLPISFNTIAPYTLLADDQGAPLDIPTSSEGLRKKYIDTLSTPGLKDWHYRPLDDLNNRTSTAKADNMRLGGNVRISIIDGLNINIKGQYEKISNETIVEYSKDAYYVRNLVNRFMSVSPSGTITYPFPDGATIITNNAIQNTWNLRAQINYAKTWNRHDLNILAGAEGSETKYDIKTFGIYGYNQETLTFVSDMNYTSSFLTRPSGSRKLPLATSVNGALQRFKNYFANGSYTYDNKYTVSASVRTDETNYLGIKANLRRVPLWSTGISWNITKEPFFNSGNISLLKLRTTYGWNGNIDNTVSVLPIIEYISNSWNLYNSNPFAYLRTPPNPNLTWEKVKMLNLAVEFAAFNNRISGNIEYYTKKGVDLIGSIESEPTTGIQTYSGNYASIKGKGIDVQLKVLPILLNKFSWTANINISYNTEQVTSYNVSESSLKSAASLIPGSLPLLGKPLYKIYAYKWGGLNPQNGDPYGILADTLAAYNLAMQDKNTKPEDLIYYGSAVPRIFGNILNTLTYQDLSISFNISYKFKYFTRRQSINYTNLINYWHGHSDYGLRWQKSGDEAHTNVPSETLIPNALRDRFYETSSILVEKGDHIRLRDIRLNYHLSGRLLEKISLASVDFYGIVSNFGFLWKAADGDVDPEYFDNMAPPKSYTLGVNIRF